MLILAIETSPRILHKSNGFCVFIHLVKLFILENRVFIWWLKFSEVLLILSEVLREFKRNELVINFSWQCQFYIFVKYKTYFGMVSKFHLSWSLCYAKIQTIEIMLIEFGMWTYFGPILRYFKFIFHIM